MRDGRAARKQRRQLGLWLCATQVRAAGTASLDAHRASHASHEEALQRACFNFQEAAEHLSDLLRRGVSAVDAMMLDVFLSIDGIREGKLTEAQFQTVLHELRGALNSRR